MRICLGALLVSGTLGSLGGILRYPLLWFSIQVLTREWGAWQGTGEDSCAGQRLSVEVLVLRRGDFNISIYAGHSMGTTSLVPLTVPGRMKFLPTLDVQVPDGASVPMRHCVQVAPSSACSSFSLSAVDSVPVPTGSIGTSTVPAAVDFVEP